MAKNTNAIMTPQIASLCNAMSQCQELPHIRPLPPSPTPGSGLAVITMGKMPFLLCSLPILGMGAVEQWDGVNTLHWSERRPVGHCPIVTTIAPWSRGLEGCGPLESWRLCLHGPV